MKVSAVKFRLSKNSSMRKSQTSQKPKQPFVRRTKAKVSSKMLSHRNKIISANYVLRLNKSGGACKRRKLHKVWQSNVRKLTASFSNLSCKAR